MKPLKWWFSCCSCETNSNESIRHHQSLNPWMGSKMSCRAIGHLDGNFGIHGLISWHSNYKHKCALCRYLHKHTVALASCFLPPCERSNKQSDSGDGSGLHEVAATQQQDVADFSAMLTCTGVRPELLFCMQGFVQIAKSQHLWHYLGVLVPMKWLTCPSVKAPLMLTRCMQVLEQHAAIQATFNTVTAVQSSLPLTKHKTLQWRPRTFCTPDDMRPARKGKTEWHFSIWAPS